ncbi:carboxypeptidase-like regulatory domain-containing protein [uncultured Paludibaculum sp.]|uniref:carboxypeptidase-like regulatory domain-containing protein n=1 Tax=uncultured Paludibaculum sp. TaxID=1765020 RepID=UPI002AAAA988|nr:carboxypeptidase-like regulatory domain-containing protein [uncultured Paludibaculum sp.]
MTPLLLRLTLHSALLLSSPQPAGTQAAPEAEKCSVEGVVVHALTQAGIDKVQVALRVVDESTGGSSRASAVGVYTDSNGKFRIENLEPGQYRWLINKPGYSLSRGQAPKLPPLNRAQTIRSVRIEMQPLATLSGRVIDENGDPVSGATVELMAKFNGFNRQSLISTGGSASTDDRGEFLIHRAAPGRFLLAASHMESRNVVYPLRGGGVSGYVTTFLPGVSDPDQAQWLDIAPGSEQTGLEIQLRREPVFRVRGVALDESGAPVPRFVIGIRSGVGMAPLQNRTFMNGRFEIEGLRPGSYSLLARSVTMGASPQSARAPLVVGRGDADNLQLRLSSGIRLACMAVLESTDDRAPDWQRVAITPMSSDPLGPASDDKGKPGADGAFALDIVDRGPVWFKVTGQPAQGTYLAEIRAGTENLLGTEVDLAAGLNGPLRFIFKAGAAQVNGHVEDAGGRPATAGTSVVAVPAELSRRGFGESRSTAVRTDGSYEFADLPPAEYLFYATTDEEQSPLGVLQTPEDLERRATKVRVQPGGSQSVQLRLSEAR